MSNALYKGVITIRLQNLKKKKLLYAGDACTGDVVLFEQNVYEM
jgi:hypothetical protein